MTITLRSVKGSALTHGELDGNFTDLQNQLDNTAITYDPVTLTGDTTLTAAAHANRLLICNSASPITLTLQTDAAGGFTKDDSINAVQAGTGLLSIAAGGGVTLVTVTGTTTSAKAQNRFVGTVRSAANTWLPTELDATNSGPSAVSRYSVNTYLYPGRPGVAEVLAFGATMSTTGTVTLRTMGTGNALQKVVRTGVVGAAAINTEVGVGGQSSAYLDDTPYISRTVFGVSDVIASGAKMMFGIMANQNGINSGQEPDGSHGSRATLACRSTDSQFVFVTNDNTGAPVVTTLNGGTGMPCNDATQLYEHVIEYYPTGPRRVVMTLNNLSTGATSGAITFTTNIPLPSDLLVNVYKRSSGANATAPALDLVSFGVGKFA